MVCYDCAADLLGALAKQHLSKAYGTLVRTLPAALPMGDDGHRLLLDCVARLLDDEELSEEERRIPQAVGISLLLELAGRLDGAPSDSQRSRAVALGAAHARFFRKLTAAYGALASAETRAAAERTACKLWRAGDSTEAAMLVLTFDLHPSPPPAAASAAPVADGGNGGAASSAAAPGADAAGEARLCFSEAELVDELLRRDDLNTLLRLAAKSRARQLALVEALAARAKCKLACRYIWRFGLLRAAPPPLLESLAFDLQRRRAAWLAHACAEGGGAAGGGKAGGGKQGGGGKAGGGGKRQRGAAPWDMVDVFYAQAGAAVAAGEAARGWAGADAGGAEEAGAAGAAGEAAEEATEAAEAAEAALEAYGLGGAAWAELAAGLGAALVAAGLRCVAVQGAARHGLLPTAAAAPLGAVSEAEAAAARAVSEEEVAAGPARLAAAAAAAAAPCLPLQLSLEAEVEEVACEAGLAALRLHLAEGGGGAGGGGAGGGGAARAARAVGLDAEWMGCAVAGGAMRVQWLQLATLERAWLLDIPALCAAAPAALHATLAWLLAAPHLLKVGFGLRQDLLALRGAHAALRCCAPAAAAPTAELRGQRGGGLSALCEATLGAPLDKRMQLSNWARRPLTRAQRAYAAHDAHVLVRLHAALQQAGRAPPPAA